MNTDNVHRWLDFVAKTVDSVSDIVIELRTSDDDSASEPRGATANASDPTAPRDERLTQLAAKLDAAERRADNAGQHTAQVYLQKEELRRRTRRIIDELNAEIRQLRDRLDERGTDADAAAARSDLENRVTARAEYDGPIVAHLQRDWPAVVWQLVRDADVKDQNWRAQLDDALKVVIDSWVAEANSP